MPNIKLKGQTGEVLTYEDVERVYFDSADKEGEVVYYTHGKVLEGVFIEPDFADGDQVISVPDGSLVKEATILKPSALRPENIRAGTNVAGVVGELIGDTEELTVDLDMAEGGQVITPSAEGKVLSKVIVNRPETMVPNNIRAGIDIGGVVGECEVIDYVEADFLPELTFTSALDAQFGFCFNPPGQFELIVGQTYWVVWDEVEYECTAMDASSLMSGAVFIGNAEPFGLSGNGEPFAVGVVGGGLLIACLEDNAAGEPDEHTVRIYQMVRSGLEEVVVDLDMADGDQKIVQSKDGKVLFKATVTKPETLIPENIAKDVEIGGVVGKLVHVGTDPYIEYTYNEEGKITAAALRGFTEIPDGCFAYLADLTSVDLSDSPGVTKIGNYAFRGCSSLTAFEIQKTVTSIGDYAFYGCAALERIIIPDSVTTIGNYAFYQCAALESIDIPDSVTTIGTYIFYGCTALASVTLGSVTSIPNYAFQGCAALASIVIPEGVQSIGQHAFNSCKSLANITIPDSVTSIGSSAFFGCSAIENVTIGNGVTSIANQTFENCTGITNITIGTGVTNLGSRAFYGCSSLTSITIPNGITSIGQNAFGGCTTLTSATFKDTTTWYVGTTAGATTTAVTVTNASTAATYLRSTHVSKYWTKV